MPSGREGEQKARDAIRKYRTALKNLKRHHAKMQHELNLAIKAVDELVRAKPYGPVCGLLEEKLPYGPACTPGKKRK